MATYTIAPVGVRQFSDENGAPYSGGLLYTYAAGTTTPEATYATSTGTAHTNPIVLDTAGRATIYLSATSYKFVLKTAAGVTVYTQDGIGAVPVSAANVDIAATAGEAISKNELCYLSDGSGSLTAGRWYLADADLLYASILPQLGFAVANIASAAAGTMRIDGIISDLTSLTGGTTYYASATPGAITSTAPAFSRRIGVATNTTTLVFTLNPPPPLGDGGEIILGTQVFS